MPPPKGPQPDDTTRSMITAVGATGSVLAGGAVAFFLLVGTVSFDVWPSSSGRSDRLTAEINTKLPTSVAAPAPVPTPAPAPGPSLLTVANPLEDPALVAPPEPQSRPQAGGGLDGDAGEPTVIVGNPTTAAGPDGGGGGGSSSAGDDVDPDPVPGDGGGNNDGGGAVGPDDGDDQGRPTNPTGRPTANGVGVTVGGGSSSNAGGNGSGGSSQGGGHRGGGVGSRK